MDGGDPLYLTQSFNLSDKVRVPGAVKASLEAGLRVPEDIAIVGAGNVHYSDLLRVPLSTIDQGSATIGETAADLLCEGTGAKTPAAVKLIFIPTRLVIRDSSRRHEVC